MNTSHPLNHLLETITEDDLNGLQQLLDDDDYVAVLNTHDNIGSTALIKASVMTRKAAILELLISKGTDVNLTTLESADSALIAAAVYHNGPGIDILIKHQANIDFQNAEGWTALMHAASQGHDAIVMQLVNYGANVQLQSKEGRTAVDLARNGAIKQLLTAYHEKVVLNDKVSASSGSQNDCLKF